MVLFLINVASNRINENIMKKTVLLVMLVIVSASYAQNDKNVTDNLFTVNFLVPGLEYKKGIGENSTLNFSIGTGFAITGGKNRDTKFGFFPFAEATYRYYYNFERRKGLNRRTENNSANYIAFKSAIVSGKSIIGNVDLVEDYAVAIDQFGDCSVLIKVDLA